jgi:serine protease DegS
MQRILSQWVWPAITGLAIALFVLEYTGWRSNTPPRPEQVNSYAAAVAKATPSVVNIYTAKVVNDSAAPRNSRFNQLNRGYNQQRVERSLGSGVILSEDGIILTNRHVIADADAIQVLLNDNRNARAELLGADPATDLAVLKIDLDQLSPAIIGDSNAAQVGDVVLAIGNPLGFGSSVTQGIISALGRYGFQGGAYYEDYIQTDATIHMGNSGGALINAKGELLGINSLIYTGGNTANASAGIGISLAIPINLATFVAQDLIDYGQVIRGWMGVSVQPFIPDTHQPNVGALLVTQTVANGPADRAGITPGDIITAINNEPVTDGRITMHRIALLRPGDIVTVTLIDENEITKELSVVLGSLQQAPQN